MRKLFRFVSILPLLSLCITIASASSIRIGVDQLQTSTSISGNNSIENASYGYSPVVLGARVPSIKPQEESVLVPEPASLVLFGTGILVVYSTRFLRSKAN